MDFKYRAVLFIFLFMAAVVLPGFASAMSITIGIPAKYSEVNAGGDVYFETEVKWPESTGRKDLRIEYSVKDKEGNEVAYLKVLKAIETQASFMDSISIPESTAPGMYKISASFNDYKDLNQEVAASFNVVKSGDNVLNYLVIILGALGVIVFLMVVELFVLMKRKSAV